MVKFQWIAEQSSTYAVTLLCQALEVSESGYYTWRNRPASQHSREDAQMSAKIQQIFLDHRQVYGSPRIHAVLQGRGIHCSRKRVVRLMQQLGLCAQLKKRRKPTTKTDPHARWAPNRLNRAFEAEQPNSTWVTDIKAVETAEGWLFLAVMLDLFSRMVVGWAMAATEDEVSWSWRYGWPWPEGIQKLGFYIILTEAVSLPVISIKPRCWMGIAVSMSRTANCWDNAAMEAFFATLTKECTDRTRFQSRQEARSAIFET